MGGTLKFIFSDQEFQYLIKKLILKDWFWLEEILAVFC